MYHHEHGVVMSTSAIAAMLSTILYYRRFFPYYVYNILGGLDDEGIDCWVLSLSTVFCHFAMISVRNHSHEHLEKSVNLKQGSHASLKVLEFFPLNSRP